MINTPGREQCSRLIIDLIAFLFKNQQVDRNMSSLLSKTKTKINDSSEDNESNTSIHTVIMMIFMLLKLLKLGQNLESRYKSVYTLFIHFRKKEQVPYQKVQMDRTQKTIILICIQKRYF